MSKQRVLTTHDTVSKKIIGRKFMGRSVAAQIYATTYYDYKEYVITADPRGRLKVKKCHQSCGRYPHLGSIVKSGVRYCPFFDGQLIREGTVDNKGKFNEYIEEAAI